MVIPGLGRDDDWGAGVFLLDLEEKGFGFLSGEKKGGVGFLS